ncbi:MAG: hypothetical protein Q8M44_01095 [bacterium]|nr:hypothetical protein [bacterium]
MYQIALTTDSLYSSNVIYLSSSILHNTLSFLQVSYSIYLLSTFILILFKKVISSE